MGDTKKRDQRKTSLYRKDFLGMLEKLKFQLRFKIDAAARGRRQPETREQLEWALTVCEQIGEHYLAKLPWPAMSLSHMMNTGWPAESTLRQEFVRLERTYDAALTQKNKPPGAD